MFWKHEPIDATNGLPVNADTKPFDMAKNAALNAWIYGILISYTVYTCFGRQVFQAVPISDTPMEMEMKMEMEMVQSDASTQPYKITFQLFLLFYCSTRTGRRSSHLLSVAPIIVHNSRGLCRLELSVSRFQISDSRPQFH